MTDTIFTRVEEEHRRDARKMGTLYGVREIETSSHLPNEGIRQERMAYVLAMM